ncbi:MAG TPA: glutamine-hydrolyzing carbamoyl-phosphate synthase small subunit [Candidatus Atribacteria bacterium]|nr:glutamine-hydrolyzing carbamoyl-phosphate synthase small subunit [Candidatus Atribacteria bacterium]
MKALLALEDGKIFQGYAFGVEGEAEGEVVFDTGMIGYQELLTDPSFRGQIVTITYPLVGNYGLNSQDSESSRPQVESLIVREKSTMYSNWRGEETLEEYFKRHNLLGLERIDTRALTKHIREKGALRGVISTRDLDPASLVKKAKKVPSIVGQDLVKKVTASAPYVWQEKGKFNILVVDCGVKFSILRELAKRDCRVVVYPATSSAEEIIREKPQGVVISNGPGDPAALSYLVELVRKIIGKFPILGICIGHQIMAQAVGGKTSKLKFGHHGTNHPVKDLRSGWVAMTTQNHSFVVAPDTLPPEIEITHINLNDFTLEGMKHKYLPFFSVQFHPEAHPGPHDTTYLFDEFIKMVEDNLG